jgi:ubiquinone/menaquinone biosynthesis C-methylase UbiE
MFASLFLRMLNREASSPKNRPKEIIESLKIQEGYKIADIGSGGGYFTLEFARKVGKRGKVYAVDTQRKNLDFIRRQSEQKGLDNIVFILVTGNGVNLPEAGLDLVFVRNAFHHLPERAKYFSNLKKFLKPKGKVAVIEHRPKSGFSFVAMFKHYTSVTVILREMEDAGYFIVRSFDFLSEQTFYLFGVKWGLNFNHEEV